MDWTLVVTSGLSAALFSTLFNYWMQYGQENRQETKQRYQEKLDFFIDLNKQIFKMIPEFKESKPKIESEYLQNITRFQTNIYKNIHMLNTDQQEEYKRIEDMTESITLNFYPEKTMFSQLLTVQSAYSELTAKYINYYKKKLKLDKL